MRLVERGDDWDTVYRNFHWQVPESLNIAQVCCDRHADDAERIALYYEDEQGQQATFTFGEIQQQANRLANALVGLGVERGDRVGIVLPQRSETAIAHIAIYKIGAIAIPLANLFGPSALEYRLGNATAKAVIVDGENVEKIREIRGQLPQLQHVLLVEGEPCDDEQGFAEIVDSASDEFITTETKAEDPAVIIYTSGTTGPPKGALHAHRYLYGHLSGFELSHNFFPQEGDLGWTPADWAWIGGLMDLLMPCWFYGKPVLAFRARKFDPEKALALMAKYRVRNVFMPPTALKLLRQVPDIPERFDLDLRTIMSGGEALGEETLHWAREQLGTEVNEIYGQTEVNYVIGNCNAILPVTPGSMGKPYPGHEVEIIDEQGNVLPAGELGEIAFRRGDDPVFFLQYWNAPVATSEKFKGEWACSGDLAVKDEQGRFWFKGRKDDVIISAGYRIGPTEIEESLLGHPAVAMAAVIGVPDELRGSVVKAFVQLATGYEPADVLAAEIQAFVKKNLAAHEYPREIEFVDSLPMTTTGKIRRKDLRTTDEEKLESE